jgi:hypothetical protein
MLSKHKSEFFLSKHNWGNGRSELISENESPTLIIRVGNSVLHRYTEIEYLADYDSDFSRFIAHDSDVVDDRYSDDEDQIDTIIIIPSRKHHSVFEAAMMMIRT